MKQCDKCREFIFGRFNESEEKCACEEFTIINEDGEEFTVFANDGQLAALKYAEESNTEGEYYLMNETAEIEVNGKKFCISAEPDVHYSAKEI